MFVYEANSPIDYFKGMTNLLDYIDLCFYHRNDESDYLSFFELNNFLVNSFMAVKCCVTSWEGDIRGDNIYIGAIPFPFNSVSKLLAFKQDNNGTSFIVSEHKLNLSLPDKEEFKECKLENLVPNIMMMYFKESFDLSCKFLDRESKNIDISQAQIINIEDLKEFLDKKSVNKTSNEIKINSNKFDLNNYERI